MPDYGRRVLTASTGIPLQVSSDGVPVWKTGGITIDWETVPPADGARALRYGTVLCQITETGLYGPYDPDADDGRETLARGKCYILNETILERGVFGSGASDHPAVIEGGRVWEERLLIGGDGQPAVADFLAAFPGVSFPTAVLDEVVPIAPDEIASLLLRYSTYTDSLDGFIEGEQFSPWLDDSGNGYNATQGTTANKPTKRNEPGINGYPMVRFDGTNDVMVIPSGVSATPINTRSFSLFIIGRRLSTSEQEVWVRLGTGLEFAFQQVSGPLAMSAGGDTVESSLEPPTNPSFFGVVGASTESRFYVNGQSETAAAFTSDTTTSGAGQLMGYDAGSFRVFGDLAEVLLYTGVLTDEEVAGLRAWADTIYAILTTRTKQLFFVGDNLTRGMAQMPAFGDSYPEQVATELLADDTGWEYWNAGKDGGTTQDLLDGNPATVDDHLDSGFSPNIICVWAGTNDLYNGVSGATVLAHLETYWAARRATGQLVVAFTVLPRSDAGVDSGFDAARATLNTAIRAASSLYDALADVAADTTIGDDGDELDTDYYDDDHVHLKSAAHAIVATIALAAINSLL